jgi:hypothetical protein
MVDTSRESSKHRGDHFKNEIECYAPDARPYGISYGAWTIKWWKWWFSIERARNPAIDQTGIYASQKQSRPVWFLAGTWVKKDRTYPHRKCSVPTGVSILFPVINCEENPLEYPNLTSDKAMRDRLSEDMATVRYLKCVINGQIIQPQLVESDPLFFSIRIRKDMSESNRGGITRMTSTGYWVFFRPLDKRSCHLSFEGSYQHGSLFTGATYEIKIDE